MNRVRLLPIVIVAASGLLVLKATDLVSRSGTMLAAEPTPPAAAPPKVTRAEDLPKFARALIRQRISETAESDITGSVAAKKDEKKDEKKGDAKKEEPKKEEAKKEEAKPVEQRPPDPLPPPAPSASERAVLERLQERRGAMDERAREMEMREALLQAAERKIDGRITDLKAIEDKLDAGAKAEKAEIDKQLKTVVVMYETMKPKDAARVFDRLKLDVLVPVASAMKPQRMAEILAAMSPEAAERLTVAMATKGIEAQSMPASAANAAPAGELPRIDQPQARPRR